jgi:hypothetical protein
LTFLFRDRGANYEVRAYDAHLQLRWERQLELEKRNAEILDVTWGDDVIHCIYGFKHRGDYRIMHRVYSPELNIVDTVVVHVDEKDYFSPGYRTALSEDRSKILLYQAEKEDQISVIVYSMSEQKSLTDKVIYMEDGSVRRSFRQMLVSDAGDVLMVFDELGTGDRNRKFTVVHVSPDDQNVDFTDIHLADLIATDLHSAFDNEHRRLVLGGLFSERMSGKSRGIYIVTMDLEPKQVQLRTAQFNEEVLQNVYGKEVSTNRGVSNFAIEDIVLRQDGGAVLIAEMAKEYSRRPNLPGRRDFTYPRGGWVDYYYEDLIVYAFNPNGTEHWDAVLHKKQYSQDDDAMYSSYFLFRTPEKLRLLFNDEIRQENMVSEYVLRGNGYFRRQSVFSTDYQRLRLRLRDAVQVSWNSCVVPSERNGRLSLVKVTFEEEM